MRYFISREAASQVLENLYHDRGLLAEHSRRSREFALGYSWNRVVDQWDELLSNAPPRRKPERSRLITWVGGKESLDLADLPPAVAQTMVNTFASIPEGAKVSVRMADRRQGEVSAEILQEAFKKGDELSIPVRLPPFFPGAPRPTVGYLLVSPPELSLAVLLRRLFPGLSIAVPRPQGDPENPEQLPLEQLLPALPHFALVLDLSGTGASHLDLGCAALGVPYVGPSPLWPEIGPVSPLHQVRLLLTDQGFSEWRRWQAAERALEACGPETIQRLRDIAISGQPDPGTRQAPAPDPEMFLVRPREDAADDADEQIADYVSRQGGLILMATTGQALFVAMPPGGKGILEACPFIGFVGGVHLEGQGKATRALRQRFAINAAKQLVLRQGGQDPAGALAPRG